MLNKKMHLKSPTARKNHAVQQMLHVDEINLNTMKAELLSHTQQAAPSSNNLLLKGGTPGGPGQRITAEQSARAIGIQKGLIHQDYKKATNAAAQDQSVKQLRVQSQQNSVRAAPYSQQHFPIQKKKPT